MAFVIYFGALILLVVLFRSSDGEFEKGSLSQYLSWLCIGAVFLCAISVMASGSFWGGLAMIGSLSFFSIADSGSDAGTASE